MATADFDGRFTRVNPAWTAALGYAEAELLSKPMIELVHPDDRERTLARTSDLQRGARPTRFRNRCRRRDGSYRWLEWSTVADREARTTYSVARDVTETIEAQAELARKAMLVERAHDTIAAQNASLEQRVEVRTTEHREAVSELDSLTYTIAHNLRAPLRAMTGFVDVLMEDALPQLDAEAREALEEIRSGAVRMGQLMDQTLAFARLGRQTLMTTTVDPAAIARRAADQLAGATAGREVDLTILPMPPVVADAELLEQVFSNLLANALEFTRDRRPARIEVGGREQAGRSVCYVEDNGTGFDVRYAEKVFGVFQQLHGRGEHEGTGVGLAMVRRIVELHGGRVWAESQPERGATFFFTLGGGDSDQR